MTRLFLEGRTETVRPCSAESAAFVHAMCDSNSNVSTCSLPSLLFSQKYCQEPFKERSWPKCHMPDF